MSQHSLSHSRHRLVRAGAFLRREAQDGRRHTGLFVVALVLVVVLGAVAAQPSAIGPRDTVAGALLPAMRAASWVSGGLTQSAATLGDNRRLSEENTQLAQQNRQLAAEVAELQATQSQNAQLRAALQFQQQAHDRTVAAPVVARDPDGLQRSLTIAEGSAAGIRVGMTVVTGAGLVGRVRTVQAHSAVVQTTADPQFSIAVQTATTSLNGTAQGGRVALPVQLTIGPSVQPQGGEAVVTAGTGGVPAGIPVGILSTVGQGAGLHVAGAITPLEDLSQVTFVVVVLGPKAR
ncbi:MAG: rod shape-determining protein MreC [Candidatus Dormiibacterota bacterium]